MKAIICTKYGSPEVLEMREVEKPSPKENEVLIKVHATSVTASDVLIRKMDLPPLTKFLVQLAFGFGKPRNPILGMVTAGVVEGVGSGVSMFKCGDEVFAHGSLSTTKRRFGSYAEYICLPEKWNLALKPKNLSFEEAAAIPYGGLLAYHLLVKSGIKSGDQVLIYGASGSIGTMMIQLAKESGASITSVCSSRNFELVQSLGSDHVIDYKAEDAISQLGSYDYVIDAVGNSKTSPLKEKSKKALNAGGKYISIDDGIPETPIDAFHKLKEFAENGKLTPVIDRIFPLEQITEAHAYVETGRKRGSVIVVP